MNYVVLIETSEEKRESWYYFLQYEGNKDNLRHLERQLNSVEWKLLPGLCSFQLDVDFLVSETTARQMSKLKMNFIPHQKLNGKLKKIYFDIDNNVDGNVTKMGKIYDTLKFGRIAKFFKNDDYTEDGDDEEDDDEEDDITHTDYESISSSDSEGHDAPSPEILQQLKDFLTT
jgi:hypothetical protein